MRRRTFINVLGGALATWSVTARAQQSSNKIPVVGVLWHAGSAEEEDVYLSVLVKAFNDLGYATKQAGCSSTQITAAGSGALWCAITTASSSPTSISRVRQDVAILTCPVLVGFSLPLSCCS
jgi:hypothetical protein